LDEDALRRRLDELEARSAELEESRRRFAHVLEIARIGMWELDLVTMRAEWSPETRRILGVAAGVAPTPATVMAVTEPEDRHIISDAIANVLAGSRRYDITYRIRIGEGQRIIHSRGDVMVDEAGRPRRISGIVQDVTEQEQLRAHMLQSQKLETVGRLAAGLAHDLNNMLTVIQGSCTFLHDAVPPGSTAADDVATIVDAANRAATLTRSLLAFSRQQLLRPRPTAVNQVIENLKQMLRRLLGENITLEAHLADDLELVMVDPQQLTQVLVNLAINARDAMPSGGTLRFRTARANLPADVARAEGAAGAFVLVRVEDSGAGMDERTLARCFEPFFTTKPPHAGTGLGLSSALGVVAQSGGYMRAESRLGAGSAFEVYLPSPREVLVPFDVERAAAEHRAGNGARVLVVEDDDDVRRTVVRALQRAGYEVLEVADGEAALRLGARVDALVVDVLMPGMSGREVADRLLADNPELRVLFMSGYSGDPRVATLGPRPGEPFLPKPFSTADLVGEVARLVGATHKRT